MNLNGFTTNLIYVYLWIRFVINPLPSTMNSSNYENFMVTFFLHTFAFTIPVGFWEQCQQEQRPCLGLCLRYVDWTRQLQYPKSREVCSGLLILDYLLLHSRLRSLTWEAYFNYPKHTIDLFLFLCRFRVHQLAETKNKSHMRIGICPMILGILLLGHYHLNDSYR